MSRPHRAAGRCCMVLAPRRSRACARPPAAGWRCGRAGRDGAGPACSRLNRPRSCRLRAPPRWRVRGLVVRDVELAEPLAGDRGEARLEGLAPGRREARRRWSSIPGLEGLDLEFAVADEAQRHRLHAAGRARARQLAPQDRRQGEADEIVERAAREIGIDQRPSIWRGCFMASSTDCLGDGVEHDALDGPCP